MDGEYKVTLLVYSGLPDPVWWIHPHHEKFKEIKELLEDARVRGIIHRHEHAPAILGYRGFLLHHPQAEHADLILGRETTALQNLLLGTMPEGMIHHTLHQKTSQAIDSGTVSPNLDVPSSTGHPSWKVVKELQRAVAANPEEVAVDADPKTD